MVRFFLIVAAFTPWIGAHTTHAQGTSPIEVTGRISPVDKLGFVPGQGLFMDVRNLSAQGIQCYVYETFFTDPATGKSVGGHHRHGACREAAKGPILKAGEWKEAVKPYPLPATPSGSIAQYSFQIDRVVFEDGSRWSPGPA